MNTKDDWKTTAAIHDELRRELWSVVFPGARIPIKSILPVKANVSGHEGVGCYMLDLAALTEDEVWSVAHILSSQFNIPVDEVRAELHLGVPILAEGVSVSSSDQGLMLSMMADDSENYNLDRDEEPYRWDTEDGQP